MHSNALLRPEPASKLHPSNLSPRPIPLQSLISQLLTSLRQFVQSDSQQTWGQHLAKNKKPQALGLLTHSWELHSPASLECQLLTSLLGSSDRRKLQLYLRLRKYTTQLTSNEHLDQIMLKHQDAITIIHRMFPAPLRKEISHGIKQMFISFKVADARISGCVLIELLLSIYDSTGSEEQSMMAGETKITSQVQLSNFSSIVGFNSNLVKFSGMQRGLRGQENEYAIIQTKFLPQQFKKKQTNFSNQDQNQSYEYTNSLSFSQQNSDQKDRRQRLVKVISIGSNKQNFILNQKSSGNLSGRGQLFEPKKEILIEDSFEHSSHSSSRIQEQEVPLQLKQMVVRNQQFKKRMLCLNGEEAELSRREEIGLKQTINIIHSSIVHSHSFK